ncbi:DegT/DnrJ/EryC1/StrS family aminotransferase [Shimia sp. R10_1]|uniref:DegT/DnrJ/EryC1/StrS family aminotransferase n=1 Tax=Shimia sp. R10_1 TaxID=2821095 RepID=UPI001ADA55DC|nr:DegT/DnrJ/EryC1/StrS family aminotransferase [Shimia sp. R10_1]MBO9473662.1 DegT/DnrJ/EryC1/StrS family aminotransferase [Shimia sp. R10_1]
MKKKIYVTKPFLPPLEEFISRVEKIWESGHLTNGGPQHQALETALAEYLNVPHVSLFNNGTIALITALQALEISGEVITTPFSFVATSNALVWHKNTPVFVDIEPETLNLDPSCIEAAITPKTSAIMPVHCYGNPCDMKAIETIAEKHKIKVIYDAAHAFAVEDLHGSVLTRGDISALSFHATKVFNTFEGGALVCKTPEMKSRIDSLKNFGIEDELTVSIAGINGKMSEINAAMGLTQLGYIDGAIEDRGRVDAAYRTALNGIRGVKVLGKPNQTVSNFAYFPILIDDNYPVSRDELYQRLREQDIMSRRYFYPLIPEFPMFKDLPSAREENLPVATKMAKRILCLPIYPGLDDEDLKRIVDVIKSPAEKVVNQATTVAAE